MATLAEQLAEARIAYHRLMLGEAPLVYVDQSGERVEYNRASASKLAAYIADLERLSAGQSRPAVITFQTSKGLT